MSKRSLVHVLDVHTLNTKRRHGFGHCTRGIRPRQMTRAHICYTRQTNLTGRIDRSHDVTYSVPRHKPDCAPP